ncbi:hypothetical protein [Chitinophaga ginsengisoli]|uniref:Uncharacterized protein n=1 Tax=Chitinophaga ginsengisoli TaxID=363837 RepID=A0A2P8FF09_9BACT|nr:hypothetical protein [Chitinophaga ginsengisoli]PSL20305.1 hypothetical protein CLV42_1256 [Chitinophaga ginsengisoli]
MNSHDELLAIKQMVQFNFYKVVEDKDRIRLKIVYRNQKVLTDWIYLNKSDFDSKRNKLSVLLAKFIKSRSKRDLYELAYIGYDMFKKIDEELEKQDKDFYALDWNIEILNNIKSTKKPISKVKYTRVLEANFPPDFSFCLGLMFPREPNKQEWEEYSTSELLQLFFDFRFKIINNIDRAEFKKGLYLHEGPLKNGATIKAIHATNSDLHISDLEKNALAHDPSVMKYEVESYNDLIDFWKNKEHPRFILFSTHYSEEVEDRFRFTLTHDNFTNHHLVRIGKIPHDQKALLFLNCCKTGNLPYDGFSNVLTYLYPDYSLGFITTAFNLRSADADAFPDRFNRIFMQENMMILDAFVKTKNFLVFQSTPPQYAAFGYMLWQVAPDLTYAKKSIKRINRKVK